MGCFGMFWGVFGVIGVLVLIPCACFLRAQHMVEDKVHCLTAEHDVLTGTRGWIPIAEVTMEDTVATLDDAGCLTYEHPIDVLDYPDFEGSMVRVRSPSVDLEVTADHQMYVVDDEGKPKLVEAGSLIGKRAIYRRGGTPWICPDLQLSIPLPEGALKPEMMPLLRFYGRWLVSSSLRVRDVEALMHPALKAFLLLSTPSALRRLPGWVWDLGARQALELLDSIFIAVEGGGDDDSYQHTFCTPSSGLADDVSRLALHAGLSAMCRLSRSEGEKTTRYVVRINYDNDPAVDATSIEDSVYAFKGPVYCLTMPGPGVFYVRRNGKPVWTGNSRGANGPVVLMTRQPAEGRARDGGLRLGEMELECLWAHGAMYFLKERFMECSDNYRVFVCTRCGMMATVNPENGIYSCKACKNITEFAEIRIPYAAKLLLQEVQTMSIGARFTVKGPQNPRRGLGKIAAAAAASSKS